MIKKIGFIYTSPYPAKRGFSAADRRVRDLVRGLAAAGAEIDLLIPFYHKKASTAIQEKGFKTRYIGKNPFGKFLVLNRLFYWLAVIQYSRKHHLDVNFLYNTQADSVIAAKILRLLKIKVVLEICDFHSNNDLEQFSLRTWMASWTEKNLPRNSDLIVVISKMLKNIVNDKSPKTPVMITPILVDTDFFYEGTDDLMNLKKQKGKSFLISYVGGMWHHQGVRFLIAAVHRLVKEGYDVKLLIAGKYSTDPNCDDVLGLIKDFGLEKHALLPGWVQTPEVKNIMDVSDLLVICQTKNVFAQAGLPTKLAEYAACGKPILITDVGDVKNYFNDKESCVICSPEDEQSIAEGIKYIIENPDIAFKMGQNALRISEEVFDYRKNGKTILEKMDSLK